MRMSALFGSTLREAPAGAASAGAALLARAGFTRQPGAGGTVYLPLGARAIARIERRLLDELQALGAQEIRRAGDEPDLRMVASLVETEVRSWRHLPRLLAARPAGAPGPVLGFLLDADDESLGRRLDAAAAALGRAVSACGLEAREAETGGGKVLVVVHEAGETELAHCTGCGYTALRDAARFARVPAAAEDPLPLQKAATPACTTIDELSRFLGIDPEKTAKAVLLVADEERFVFAVVRGDREAGEARLRAALEARTLRPATGAEIRAAGAVPGYASPIGLPPSTLVVVDPEVAASANLAAGANQEGFHFLHTNVGRDYTPGLVHGIAALPPGACCAECGKPLEIVRGFDLAGLRRVSCRPVARALPVYQDAQGRERPVCLAQAAAHAGRILAAAAECHRDERGLRLFPGAAPLDAHVVTLGGGGTEAMAAAERLCGLLAAQGLETLLDDRDESPGVKFADADLIGIPVRITVSARSLAAGGVEVKLRGSADKTVMEPARAAEEVRAACRPG